MCKLMLLSVCTCALCRYISVFMIELCIMPHIMYVGQLWLKKMLLNEPSYNEFLIFLNTVYMLKKQSGNLAKIFYK